MYICREGLPLLVVGGSAIYDTRYYEDTHPDFCMASAANPLQHILFLIAPCVLLMAANVIIFLRVTLVLLRKRKPLGYRLDSAKPLRVTWAQVCNMGRPVAFGVTA